MALIQNKHLIDNPRPKDPNWVSRIQKMLSIAKIIQGHPAITPEGAQIIQILIYDMSAIPEVSGIRTTVAHWDKFVPKRNVFGRVIR